jgi:hypothetical protein
MMMRVLIEFVVDVPHMDIANDVETRIGREHIAQVCETLQSVTGYEPLLRPGSRGLAVMTEPVTWSASDQDWIGPDDDNDDDDDDDE